MCGICGFTQADDASLPTLKAMCDVMAHRGPDGEGQYIDAESGIALGHRRLSLIDLANGNQPMVRSTGDHAAAITSPALRLDGTPCGTPEQAAAKGRFAIVFNGEIYNYRDLRAELEAQGWQFQTNSDTEVLLTGYLAWGEGVLDRLRGMFAFAIWDRDSRELFCARDFFGIKPFYYTQQNGRFIFASEIKCILEHPDYTRELNREALEQYLCFQFSALPETFFKGIFKLAPAHCMTVHADGSITERRYWRPEYNFDAQRSRQDTVEAIDEASARQRALPQRGRRRGRQLPVLGHRLQLHGGLPGQGKPRHQNVHRGIRLLQERRRQQRRGRRRHDARRDLRGLTSSPTSCTSPTPTSTSARTSTGRACLVCSGTWTSRPPTPPPWHCTSWTRSRQRRSRRCFPAKAPTSSSAATASTKRRSPTPSCPGPRRACCAAHPGVMRKLGIRGANYLERASETPEDWYYTNANGVAFTVEERAQLLRGGCNAPTPQQLTAPVYAEVKDLDETTRMQYVDLYFWLVGDILLKTDKMSMAHSLESRVPFLGPPRVRRVGNHPHARSRPTKRKPSSRCARRPSAPSRRTGRRRRSSASPSPW